MAYKGVTTIDVTPFPLPELPIQKAPVLLTVVSPKAHLAQLKAE